MVRNAVFKRRSLNLMTECLPMTSSFQEARAGARTRFTFLLLNKLKNLRASRETTAELRRFDATHRLSELGPPYPPSLRDSTSVHASVAPFPACLPACRSVTVVLVLMNVLACGEDDENARCGAGGGGAAPTKAAMAETQLALLPSLLPLLLPAPGACLDPGLPTHLVYPTTSPASLPRLLGFA